MADNAAPARRAVLRFDVGKASRWACMLTRDGEVAANRPVASSEHELDRLFSQVGEGTLVVVDQVRNIGALPISRARGGPGPTSPTCPAWRRTRPPGCSPATPRPTSGTPS